MAARVRASELTGGTKWLNSKPLTLKELKGKVVLVDFWTYTCVNCLRTLPFIKEWHNRYQDSGLVIIGVHTPEFTFEKEEENVSRFIQQNEIDYPVVLDNYREIWNRFANKYWPSKYLIGGKGYIRYQHFGEGAYAQTEQAIQQLLKEADSENLEDYLSLVFHSFEVNAVMRSSGGERFSVYSELDGKPLKEENKGRDVQYDSQGSSFVHLTEPKMYNLLNNLDLNSHVLKMRSNSDQWETYAFTFGACTKKAKAA